MKAENKISPEALLTEGKSIQIKPQGYSMYPLIVPGRDSVVIVPATAACYRRGDVVLFRNTEGKLVLHRVLQRKKNAYYMVGDNQKEPEGPIARERIIGVLTEIIRNGRSFSVKHPLYIVTAHIWLLLRPCRPAISHAVAKLKQTNTGTHTEHRNNTDKEG